jgi:ketosteroid isomerase-like protein
MRHSTSIAIVLISLLAVILSQAQSKDPTDLAAVKQVEQSMGEAMVAGDIDKLNRIYADDFATIGSSGEITTKQNLVRDFESFHDKLEWFENGPMDVQVFGNVALAQGLVKEKRSRNGKDTSGQFLWQDLLQKRAGKWVVWRSAAARVVLADSPKTQSQDPTVVESIKHFEQEIGDAMVAGNIERLLSFENGPIDVQALGDVAVVQTSVTEKRIQDGKDISGQFVFMDLLKKREGKWVIVRTLGTRVS